MAGTKKTTESFGEKWCSPPKETRPYHLDHSHLMPNLLYTPILMYPIIKWLTGILVSFKHYCAFRLFFPSYFCCFCVL